MKWAENLVRVEGRKSMLTKLYPGVKINLAVDAQCEDVATLLGDLGKDLSLTQSRIRFTTRVHSSE